jgi:predicted amidohydrolase YtcJ
MPGMAADLIALDRNPFATECLPLKETKLLLTMVRGAVVHDAMPQFPEWRSGAASA